MPRIIEIKVIKLIFSFKILDSTISKIKKYLV